MLSKRRALWDSIGNHYVNGEPTMPTPQVGQTVENLELLTPAGEVIHLEDLLDREYLLLIFLRHLT